MNRAPIFSFVGAQVPGIWDRPGMIAALDRAIDEAEGKATRQRSLVRSADFFAAIRLLTGSLNKAQVDTINALCSVASRWPIGWLAYGLATAWHEARFEPVPEMGRGKGKPYGKVGKYGQAQYGRGLVQITWDRNYEWADGALDLNGRLLADFDLALRPDIATRILVLGMETGAFTGKKLADYLPGERGTLETFVQARHIINVTDRALLIARVAVTLQSALETGGWA